MSWGYRIAILYLGFVALMLFMVIKTFQYDVNLVTDDYYEKDLNYTEKMQRMRNGANSELELLYQKEQKRLVLSFPQTAQEIKGEVLLFRPSDRKQDVNMSLVLDSLRQQKIPTDTLSKGKWRLKVEWEEGPKGFFKEQVVVL